MDDQERICKWCEENILGCRHSTQTFLCEGAFCEQAAADIKDVYPFNLVRQNLLNYITNGNTKFINRCAH